MRAAILLAPLVLSWAGATEAAEYHVDAAAPAGGDGTPEAPLNTIAACAALVGAGDTCVIHGGTYHEANLTPARSGEAGRYISFQAAPGSRPILDGSSVEERAFSIARWDYVRVSGLEFQYYVGRPIVYFADADYGVIERNLIHDVLPNEGHLKGIELQDTQGTLVEGNTVHSIVGTNEGFGIVTDGYQRDIVIRGNLVYFNDKSGIRVVCQSGESSNILVEGNIAIHNAYAGIEVNSCWPSDTVIVRNNFVGFNGAAGFHPKHTYGVVLENNTIVENLQYGIWSAGGTGINANTEHRVLGNIFYDNAEGVFFDQGNIDLNPVLDYSLYRNEGYTDVLVDIESARRYSTLEELAAATTFEAHGLVADPLFTNPSAGDYTLQPGSPAVGSAADGGDRGARVSAVQAVGAERAASLAAIPDLNELPLTVQGFSSETAAGPATNAVDRSRRTLWIPATTGPEWIELDLPGEEALELSRLVLLRYEHESADNPAAFTFAVRETPAAAWKTVDDRADPFTLYIGAAGRIWKLPPATRAAQVRLELLSNHGGSQLELAGVRIYGPSAEEDGGTDDTGTTGGCGCRTGRGQGSIAWALFAIAGGVCFLRRRRR